MAGALPGVVGTTARAAGTPVRHSGYLTMDDGTKLRYTLVLPADSESAHRHLPTLFEYSGYDPGTNPDAGYIRQFVEQDGGYAYIGVNLRGTGCSEGTFDFFQPQEARDGAAVIDWVTHQTWSDGQVGMIGKSYPGITQLFVAEEQPPGLKAIAPGHFFADAYRDVARPGGIVNDGFSTLWSFVGRPSYEYQSSPGQLSKGDPGCLRGITGEPLGLPTNPFVQLLQHPWDDALIAERSPVTRLDRIQVPMLATLAWQDEQLASRQTDLLARLDDLNATRAARGQAETPWWATLTSGDHGMARTSTELADLERFYDHVLKHEDNGWDTRPRVQVWWESGRDGGARAPGWVSGLDHWSEAQRIAGGALAARRLGLGTDLVRSTPSATWTTVPGAAPVAGSQGLGNPRYGYPALPDAYLWGKAPARGTAVAYTTPPLGADVTLLGSASLDLWFTSTAPDLDLQVTLTEVRPDGQEVYVQKGWLEASHRALDPARSTPLRPFQTHLAADAQPLVVGSPTLARVEIFPFGTLLRAGSRLRVWIEAPTGLPELWAFAPSPYPAVSTVLSDASHPSSLVLPVVANDGNRAAALPTCGAVIRQPCRPDPLP